MRRLPACDLKTIGWKPMPLIFRTMLSGWESNYGLAISTSFVFDLAVVHWVVCSRDLLRGEARICSIGIHDAANDGADAATDLQGKILVQTNPG